MKNKKQETYENAPQNTIGTIKKFVELYGGEIDVDLKNAIHKTIEGIYKKIPDNRKQDIIKKLKQKLYDKKHPDRTIKKVSSVQMSNGIHIDDIIFHEGNETFDLIGVGYDYRFREK